MEIEELAVSEGAVVRAIHVNVEDGIYSLSIRSL